MREGTAKVSEWLLRRLVPGQEGEIIAGDLREEFEARGGGRFWYWAEVLSCIAVRLLPHRLVAPDWRRDLHYAARVLRRNPGYTLTAMVCLALGIGVNSTVFAMMDELFWELLPVPQSDRVAAIGAPARRPLAGTAITSIFRGAWPPHLGGCSPACRPTTTYRRASIATACTG